jgi:hypothetical protein
MCAGGEGWTSPSTEKSVYRFITMTEPFLFLPQYHYRMNPMGSIPAAHSVEGAANTIPIWAMKRTNYDGVLRTYTYTIS